MKNIVIAVLFAAALALAALFVVQRNKAQTQSAQAVQTQTRLTAAEEELKAKTEAVEKAAVTEQKSKLLQQTLAETSAAAVEKSKQAAQLQQSLDAAKTNSGGLAGLFKDPQMKEMIKAQQKAVLGPMLAKTYGALYSQLNLKPEQTDALKDLLEKKMMVGADMGMSMLDGSLDADKKKELGAQVKAQTDDYDAQIKQLLGDDNYSKFQAYDKTTADRMAVGQFRDQLAGGATALAPAQEEQLVQAMNDARTNFKWTTDLSNQKPGNANFADMFTDDRVNQYALEKAQFDTQFLARAQQILTPDQLAAFEKFQTAQRNLQLVGMKMAAKMLAPQSP